MCKKEMLQHTDVQLTTIDQAIQTPDFIINCTDTTDLLTKSESD